MVSEEEGSEADGNGDEDGEGKKGKVYGCEKVKRVGKLHRVERGEQGR